MAGRYHTYEKDNAMQGVMKDKNARNRIPVIARMCGAGPVLLVRARSIRPSSWPLPGGTRALMLASSFAMTEQSVATR